VARQEIVVALLGTLMYLASPVVWYLAATVWYHNDFTYWVIAMGWCVAITLVLGASVKPPELRVPPGLHALRRPR
jgi:hypothetical protein